MYAKPSNTNPAALRKARWEREQKERNAARVASLAAAGLREDRLYASWETPRG